ncbi:LPXTG cell wall anchor domain-containing protein [Clostridium paraputrificum]|uniref:LPXTG cell wall anchor domain-containing protein n=1 Tax=Clostridium TaxID=1485 RepID=UPI003D33D5D0
MRKVKKIVVLTVSLLLILTNRGAAIGLPPPDVKLIGNANGLVSIPENEHFLEGNGMVPGDVVRRTMIIENKYEEPYELFLRTERLTEKEKYDLLEKLNLTITYNGKTIYFGPVSGEDKLEKDISLGIFNPGESKVLIGNVELDGKSTGNEYKNKYGKVEWIFTAVRAEGNKSTTKTGDNGTALYLAIALISLGIGVFIMKNKKRIGEE